MALRPPARTVRIDHDATGAIITLGDHSPVMVCRESGRVFALAPLTYPPGLPQGSGPAALVAARHEVVGYVGRAGERRDAAAWLADGAVRAVRLVTAAGGQGKTRFAWEVAREAAACGWQVLIARHQLDGGLLPTRDETTVPVPGEPVGVLVVVDYADRWARADLLELLSRPEATGGKLRLLLLGRSDVFWPTLALTVSRAGVGVSERVLPALPDDGVTRAAMFDAAVTVFAVSAVAGGRVDPGTVARPDLSAEGFALTLAVQVAALVAVLQAVERAAGASHGSDVGVLDDPAAVSRELLVREVDHWQKLRERHPDPVTVSTRVMARAVLIATLTRGLPSGAAVGLLGELGVGADAQTVVDEHGQCYPVLGHGHVLDPLYPDRLGEDFIAALVPGAPETAADGLSLEFLADPAAVGIVETLTRAERDAVVRIPAWTILVEVARRWPHVAATVLPWIHRDPALLVGCGGTVIARAATVATLGPALPALGALLDATIGAGVHLTLDPGAVVVQEQLVTRAGRDNDPVRHANALITLGVRLASVGRRPEALHAAEESAALYRELAVGNRDAYLPDLAASVNNLAVHLAELGRRPEALHAAEEAATLYRELDERQPGLFEQRRERNAYVIEILRGRDTPA